MRRHAFLAFENAVEVSHVVESAAVSDLGDGHIGVYQHARHVPQADLGQRIDEALPGDFLDETAECHGGRRKIKSLDADEGGYAECCSIPWMKK